MYNMYADKTSRKSNQIYNKAFTLKWISGRKCVARVNEITFMLVILLGLN